MSMMYEYFVTSGMDDLLTYPVTERFYSTRYYKGAKTDDTPSSGKEFLEKGYTGASLRTIAENAGTTVTISIPLLDSDDEEILRS